MNLYILAFMSEDPVETKSNVLDGISAGDWYTSEIAALVTMDQWNAAHIDNLGDEEYASGDFELLGVFKYELAGLVGMYDN